MAGGEGKGSLRPYRCWAPCKSTFASAAALGVHQIKCRHNPALRRTNISTPLTRFLRPSVPVPQNLTPLPSPTAGNRVVTACATSTTPITYQILSPPPTPPSPEVNDGADNTRITGLKRKLNDDDDGTGLSDSSNHHLEGRSYCPKKCGKHFVDKCGATRHALYCGITPEEKKDAVIKKFAGDPRHVCSKCGEVFASTSMKSSHEDICILTAEEVKLKYKDDESHFCQTCGDFFVQVINRTTHQKSCGATIDQLHIKFKDDPRHWCTDCGEFFIHYQSLRSHVERTANQMKRVHPLNHNKTAIGNEDCLDPSFPNYSEIIEKKLQWVELFSQREVASYVYRAFVLGPLFRRGTDYREFILQHPEQTARYSGMKSEDGRFSDINNWHKQSPPLSALGRGHMEGLEVVFGGDTLFEGPDAGKDARALEALEINFGYYYQQYSETKMRFLNTRRELSNLAFNPPTKIKDMIEHAVRGDDIVPLEASLTKVEFSPVLCDNNVVTSTFSPLNISTRPRPTTEADIMTEVDTLFGQLMAELRLLSPSSFNVYSVLLFKKADLGGVSRPREILEKLLGSEEQTQLEAYHGKGVEASDGGINRAHYVNPDFDTILKELKSGEKIALQVARTRCTSREDAEEKEAFLQYETGVVNRKKPHGIVRIVPLNIRTEWAAWRRLPDHVKRIAQESGERGIMPFSFGSATEDPLWKDGDFEFPINLRRQLSKPELKVVDSHFR
ncbi:uncharacterized protein LOC110851705 isoform X2 [Folsomia candida]|uniref:uncharacterized protein LOC110851705 isoform X2 n=1 Tax=Folsomia candida TaxID=158441 RepID=UPI0016055795|nr:uncharacterized protein LOC110851705 isoform X2 [Folsomia candida]